MFGESEANILQALYEGSSVIKDYVDSVAGGNALPFTILIKDSDMEDNQMKIIKLTQMLTDEFDLADHEQCKQVCNEVLELLDIHNLEDDYADGKWEVHMLKDGVKVDGTVQIVTTRVKLDQLTNFAKFKGYVLYAKEIEDEK